MSIKKFIKDQMEGAANVDGVSVTPPRPPEGKHKIIEIEQAFLDRIINERDNNLALNAKLVAALEEEHSVTKRGHGPRCEVCALLQEARGERR